MFEVPVIVNIFHFFKKEKKKSTAEFAVQCSIILKYKNIFSSVGVIDLASWKEVTILLPREELFVSFKSCKAITVLVYDLWLKEKSRKTKYQLLLCFPTTPGVLRCTSVFC